jgi:hypothetical protein
MNERRFKTNIFSVIAAYCVAVVLGVSLKIYDPGKDAPLYSTFKDLVPLIIAIPAAWLAYCFQRRQAYLKDVRELWSMVVVAIQDSIQYTHFRSPEQSDYGKVLCSLSTAIEEMRTVFMNVGEEGESIGLFPFESIKTIHTKVSSLGFGTHFNSEDAKAARYEIVELFKKLRRCYLAELQRGVPANIDTPFLKD